MAWPLIVAGALAAGGALSNYLGNKSQSENLQDAYDRIQGLANQAVDANSKDIQSYKDFVSQLYGNGAGNYNAALQNFLNSPVYQNQGFSYDKGVDEFYDPYANQRVQAAMDAINASAATGGNRFSSDFIGRVGAKQQSMASEEWEKAYNKLMQDRQQAMSEYNINSQNSWNNYNANQSRLQAAVDAYGGDRDKYYEGQGTALAAGIQNRLGGLNTQAQTIMGGANAKQGTSGWDLASGLLGAGANFMGSYFGGGK